jgi:hypothetical protein
MKKDLKESLDDKSTPAAIKKLFTSVKLGSAGVDVTLDGSATEADLQAALKSL